MEFKNSSSYQEQNAHGGSRPGAGRKKNSRSSAGKVRVTKAMRVEVLAKAHAVLSSDMSPVDVMLKVMRGDDEITPQQYGAAVDVAPYVCPRLSAIAVQPVDDIARLSPEQIDRRLAELIAKHGPVIDAMPLMHNGNAVLEQAENTGSDGASSSHTAQNAANSLDFAP